VSLKIFSAQQIQSWDRFTINEIPIRSIDLMEIAAETFVNWFVSYFKEKEIGDVYIFCGNGNNGGDGLAIGRMLITLGYEPKLFIFSNPDKERSDDNLANLEVARDIYELSITNISSEEDFPSINGDAVIIDAIFGTGLTRKIEGLIGQLIEYLNSFTASRVAVDLPSGLMADSHSVGIIFQADYTFTFEQPKLAFFFPENHKFVGEWFSESINLSKQFYGNETSTNHYLTVELIKKLYQPTSKFDHKGKNGHALMMVGSKGKMGAAILAAKSSMRAGCGLTTCLVPSIGYSILQIAIPEVMVVTSVHADYLDTYPDLQLYDSIGMGCGIGTAKMTYLMMEKILQEREKPLVLDADALNIISENPELKNMLPKDSILTPHVKEFQRLFGQTKNDFERNVLQRKMSKELECFILLKGSHSCLTSPDGKCYFNSTGNAGMATAGSGDVLTGIITGLMAKGYPPLSAALIGVYLHGLAGDLAAVEVGKESMMASDLINFLPAAYAVIRIVR